MDKHDADQDLDLESDKDIEKTNDKDFDYDLYAFRYGIDLREDTGDSTPRVPAEQRAGRHAAGKAKAAPKDNSHIRMELYDWLQCIVAAILCGILIFVFIGRVIGVDGTSMLQTLQNEDKVVMTDLFYKPKYGDIVVVKTETFGQMPIVKRVIATAGQTVDIDFSTGRVTIDGKTIQEDYINTPTNEREDFKGPKKVPDGCVFVMGDNRNASTDSRSNLVGFVDTRQILGKVLFVLIPGPNHDGTRSWSRFGSVYRTRIG